MRSQLSFIVLKSFFVNLSFNADIPYLQSEDELKTHLMCFKVCCILLYAKIISQLQFSPFKNCFD